MYCTDIMVEGVAMHLSGEVGPSALHRAFLPNLVTNMMPPLMWGIFSKLQYIFNIKQGTNMSTAITMAISQPWALGVCHMDTKLREPSHQAFTTLEVQPGTPL